MMGRRWGQEWASQSPALTMLQPARRKQQPLALQDGVDEHDTPPKTSPPKPTKLTRGRMRMERTRRNDRPRKRNQQGRQKPKPRAPEKQQKGRCSRTTCHFQERKPRILSYMAISGFTRILLHRSGESSKTARKRTRRSASRWRTPKWFGNAWCNT